METEYMYSIDESPDTLMALAVGGTYYYELGDGGSNSFDSREELIAALTERLMGEGKFIIVVKRSL